MPYCLGEQIFNTNNYNDFIRGNGYEEFFKYVSSSEKVKEIVDYCLYPSTAKEERNQKRDLKILYDEIYNRKQESFFVKAGSLDINKRTVEYFYDLCTMLSDFTVE